jgi:hypothetical protein
VIGSDIATGADFLGQPAKSGIAAIITNPPYALAREFIERALSFDSVRVVAMLLRTDFDHGATRAAPICPLPDVCQEGGSDQRIRWFEDSNGSPSFNHCWMIWDRLHRGPPTLAYASGSAKMPTRACPATDPRTSVIQSFQR